MADQSADPRVGRDREPPTGTPRWVKVFGIVALVVVVLFIVVLLTRGPGGHGPKRHTGGLAGSAVPVSATEHGVPAR